ncbi:MAG: hypothetical protein V1837_03520 [Candidatus Woesearchaeota archaeon]
MLLVHINHTNLAKNERKDSAEEYPLGRYRSTDQIMVLLLCPKGFTLILDYTKKCGRSAATI